MGCPPIVGEVTPFQITSSTRPEAGAAPEEKRTGSPPSEALRSLVLGAQPDAGETGAEAHAALASSASLCT